MRVSNVTFKDKQEKLKKPIFIIQIMCFIDVIVAIRIIAIWLLFVDRACVDATLRYSPFRSMRPKAISFSPFLTASPPRLTAAPKFQSMEYDAPPSFYSSPQSNTPSTDYGPPPTTMKATIHKHIYVHVPPPEPEPVAMR